MTEASEVSHSDVSSASGAEEAGGGGGSKLPLIVVGAVLLFVLAGVAIYLTTAESTGDTTDSEPKHGSGGDGGGGGGGGGKGGDSGGKKPPVVPPQQPTEQQPTTEDHPTSEPINKVLKLTCTYGMTGVLKTQLPPDGVCDFIFYTHVYFDNKEKEIYPLYGPRAYKVFSDGASKYHSTEFGVSMTLGILPTVIKDSQSDLEKAMNDIMGKKIMHFGMLDVDVRDYSAASSGGLQFLKVVGEVLKGKSPPQHCALGIFNATNGGSLVYAAKKAVADFPVITMLILKVHTAKSSSPAKLFPIAPNPDSATVQSYDIITFNDIKDHIADFKDITESGTILMISIAMFARAYILTYKNKLEIANSSMVLDYSAVCKCETACVRSKDPSDASGTSTFDVRNNAAVDFFDDATSIEAKAEARLEVLPHNYTGIAAYNVETDDFDKECDASAFGRLTAIKKKITDAIAAKS